MNILDVERLLETIDPDRPCGEDLEYDSAFGEMERAAQIKAEQQFGNTVIPAEEPDWRVVKRLALELLERSKDLRTAMYLARALIRTDGLAGLADALALLHGYVTRHWDWVHPQLDPDDDNDPTMRVNIIASLCDQVMMLNAVERQPLVSSRMLGRFSLRDIQAANSEATAEGEGEASPSAATIEAAFNDVAIEAIQETAASIKMAMEQAVAIEAALDAQIGASQSPDLSLLVSKLKAMQVAINAQLSRRGAAVAETETGEEAFDQSDSPVEGGARAPQMISAVGEINGPDDVIKVLNKICEYYQKREPSSPIPLLLERARGLVSKSFMEILEELAPDGVDQVVRIAGTRN